MLLAGAVGFGPTHDGTKTRCLTTWLRPKKNVVFCTGCYGIKSQEMLIVTPETFRKFRERFEEEYLLRTKIPLRFVKKNVARIMILSYPIGYRE